eukprot:GHVT01023763.1.p2 GENE.GHVT01023763.1~~GHVT01023763.1.p2  ORF type:complete len:139 (+),score=28.65 GHVT01023763.1:575-991(+)
MVATTGSLKRGKHSMALETQPAVPRSRAPSDKLEKAIGPVEKVLVFFPPGDSGAGLRLLARGAFEVQWPRTPAGPGKFGEEADSREAVRAVANQTAKPTGGTYRCGAPGSSREQKKGDASTASRQASGRSSRKQVNID